MRYAEVKFEFRFAEEYEKDLFLQGLADLGFESFTDDAAYIPARELREPAVRAYAAVHGQTVRSITVLPEENWNAAWEEEHPVWEPAPGVLIRPRCAFGAGYHETTSMLIAALLKTDLSGRRVLDMGCGTGVLGIIAAKQGAQHVVAVDIDDAAVRNARENATENQVQLDVRLGDTPPDEPFDLILANIHLNILLAQMPAYARSLSRGGELWLSGFYAENIRIFFEGATENGLTRLQTCQKGEWAMLRLRKQ